MTTPADWRRVVIESPYAGDELLHVAYARAAVRDCLRRGESPYASHLLLTTVLADSVPEERETGITAGLAWSEGAASAATVAYCDYGVSPGMRLALDRAVAAGRPVEYRLLPEAELSRLTRKVRIEKACCFVAAVAWHSLLWFGVASVFWAWSRLIS